ncbi:hypothetical protein BGZ72_005352, partial [Mortierella alpina]
DYGKAMEWFLKASDARDATGMRKIGVMYQNGQGVEQDYGKAMEWYIKGSGLGDAVAMFNIGELYHFGKGVEQGHDKALEWYIKARDAGCEDASARTREMEEEST